VTGAAADARVKLDFLWKPIRCGPVEIEAVHMLTELNQERARFVDPGERRVDGTVHPRLIEVECQLRGVAASILVAFVGR